MIYVLLFGVFTVCVLVMMIIACFLHDEEDREEEKGQNREFPGKQENNYLCNNKKHEIAKPMKKIQGKHGGTLYAREKGDPSPKKGQVKGSAPRANARKSIMRQHKG